MPVSKSDKAALAELNAKSKAKEERRQKRADNTAAKIAKVKPPKTVGACVDKLYTMRAERLALDKKLEELKGLEHALQEHIIKTFSKAKLHGAKGAIAVASVDSDEVPIVDDWPKLQAYIKKNAAFDLLQRRLSTTAVRARWEAKKVVPGISKMPITKLSLTKARK